jgi:putative ABC transport system permease protein
VRVTLATATLTRHRARTVLAVLGVAVAAALLLDMVMLSTGMRESFRTMLLVSGFQVRITPKGTLPFDSEALIANASEIAATLAHNPDISAVSPVLGAHVFVLGTPAGHPVASFAVGVDGAVEGDYDLQAGRQVAAPDHAVANAAFLAATSARVGDTLALMTGFDPQLRTYVGRRPIVIAGLGRFFYTATGQSVVALPLPTLQAMRGVEAADRVSLFMVRVRDGVDPDRVTAWIAHAEPRVSASSTNDALKEVDQRMGYFRQLAFILGGISLLVGFLLVATLVTVSVNERIGEIAVMRAIGVSRWHIVEQVLIEGLALTVLGSVLGLALGLATARVLNGILSDFPGLPATFHFFVFRPHAALDALALLVLSGVLAGLYPSWRAASLPIAGTLRREAVA